MSSLTTITQRKIDKVLSSYSQFEKKCNYVLEAPQEPLDSDDQAENKRRQVRNLLIRFERFQETPEARGLTETSSFRDRQLILKLDRDDCPASSESLKAWDKEIIDHVRQNLRQRQYANLYGKLTNEWIDNLKAIENKPDSHVTEDSWQVVDPNTKQKDSALSLWRSQAFSPSTPFLRESFKGILDTIFSPFVEKVRTRHGEKESPLQSLRKHMKSYEIEHLNGTMLANTARNVLRAYVLTSEQKDELNNIIANRSVAEELASLLNMLIRDFDMWGWENGVVPVIFRKMVNGKIREYYQESVITALLLQHVGSSFACHLRGGFRKFVDSGKWKFTSDHTSRKEKIKRQYYFGDYYPDWGTISAVSHGARVRDIRRNLFLSNFFCCQLPTSISHSNEGYSSSKGDRGDVEEAEGDLSAFAMGAPSRRKQLVLRLLTTEMNIAKYWKTPFAFLQCDFANFGQSLSHDVILELMEYIGVNKKWIKFFEVYLKAPVLLPGDKEPKIRTCGVPMGHTLSDALSEAVLFLYDVNVNQVTGHSLHRFHDDVYLWGSPKNINEGWNIMEELNKVVGLTFNKAKTAKVFLEFDAKENKCKARQEGELVWGNLKFNIDDQTWEPRFDEIDKAVDEAVPFFDSADSVLEWVNTWNSYTSGHVLSNLGDPSPCFGSKHLTDCAKYMEMFEGKLLKKLGIKESSVCDYVLHQIETRFPQSESITAAFLLYPLERGGLELKLPKYYYLARRHCEDADSEGFFDPIQILKAAEEDEMEVYESLKLKFERGENGKASSAEYNSDNDPEGYFPSFQEFVKHRERESNCFATAFSKLIGTVEPKYVLESSEKADLGLLRVYYDDAVKAIFGTERGYLTYDCSKLPVALIQRLRGERFRRRI